MLIRTTKTLIILSIILCCSASRANDKISSGVFSTIQKELLSLELNTKCDDKTKKCSFKTPKKLMMPSRIVTAGVNNRSNTVLIRLENLFVIKAKDNDITNKLSNLLDMNRKLLAVKIDRDPNSGKVGISAVIHIDSGFDRAAFREVIRTLLNTADRIHKEWTKPSKPPNTK